MARTALYCGALVGVVLWAAACEERETPETATAELCDEIAELAAYMETHRPSETLTVGQVQEMREEIQEQVGEIRQAAGAVEAARVRALEEASDRLEEQVDRLSPDLPVGVAAESIRSEVESVAAARASLNSDVQCVVRAGH